MVSYHGSALTIIAAAVAAGCDQGGGGAAGGHGGGGGNGSSGRSGVVAVVAVTVVGPGSVFMYVHACVYFCILATFCWGLSITYGELASSLSLSLSPSFCVSVVYF